MILGFLGDIHGDFEGLMKVLEAYPKIKYWFQVGDLGAEDMDYPALPSNFFFIQGNHENWKVLTDKTSEVRKHFMQNAQTKALASPEGETVFVSSFGGNYSPKFWETARSELPLLRQRHFVREEYEGLLSQQLGQEILVTHEAASPYMHRGKDRGQPCIAELIENLQPKLHVFGHHHYYTVKRYQYPYAEVLSVGLPFGTQGFITYDTETGIMSPKMFEPEP